MATPCRTTRNGWRARPSRASPTGRTVFRITSTAWARIRDPSGSRCSGWHEGKRFVFSECIMGTWGATSHHDGQEGVPHMASNQANVPVEMIESDYPIRIEHYGFAPDTGGAGKYRGGLGVVREYRM